MYPCLLWSVWRGTNQRIFEETFSDVVSVWDTFLFSGKSWAKASHNFCMLSFDLFSITWVSFPISDDRSLMYFPFSLLMNPFFYQLKKKKILALY